MALPLDAASLRQLRLLLLDADPQKQTFSDENLGDYWELEGGVLKCAAALALETLAQNDARTLKYVETVGLKTNGKTAAEGVCLVADRWRRQVADAASVQAEAARKAGAVHFFEVCL